MQDDYYNSTTKKTIYKKRYKIILDEIESQFSVTLKDVDWIMTLHQGVEEIDLSYIVLNEINFNSELNKINSRQLIVLDTLMIYQSTMSIAKFFKSLSTKEELSKFEHYQISFYMQELRILENPSFFLTNKDDIHLTEIIYEKWDIAQQIKMAVNIALQSLTVFDFIANNREKNKTDYSALIMSYLSILLLYEPVTELIKYIFDIKKANMLDIVFTNDGRHRTTILQELSANIKVIVIATVVLKN